MISKQKIEVWNGLEFLNELRAKMLSDDDSGYFWGVMRVGVYNRMRYNEAHYLNMSDMREIILDGSFAESKSSLPNTDHFDYVRNWLVAALEAVMKANNMTDGSIVDMDGYSYWRHRNGDEDPK